MTERPEIRIGDAEREAAVAALGEHYAAGRLTKEEYDERAAIAWSAKFNSVLWPLFADLPRPPAAVPRPVAPAPSRRPSHGHPGPWLGVGILPVLVGLIALLAFANLDDKPPVLVLLGLFWLLWARTYRNAARNARRRRWDDSHRR